MSVGGFDWDSATDLTIGGSNTFNISTTVVGSDYPYFSGYWTYTPIGTGSLHLDTAGTTGSSPDTVIRVFSGADPGSETLVGQNDDASGLGTLSSLDVSLSVGVTYHIRVGTFDTDGSGVSVINLNASTSVVAPPGVAPAPVGVGGDGGEGTDGANEIPTHRARGRFW